MAGVAWENVQGLRRRGTEARLVTFKHQPFRPHESDVNLELDRERRLWRRQLVQWQAFLRFLPWADVFHFYFGLTLVPRRLQFPILRMAGKRAVYHFLGSDLRGKSAEQLAYARSADARIVGSCDARRWLPDAEVVPPGLDLRNFEPVPPSDRERPLVMHAPSARGRKGTEHVVEACRRLPVELEVVEGLRNDEARKAYARADIVVEQLNAGWHGLMAVEAMALGKPVVTYLKEDAVRETEKLFGVKAPIVSATRETLVERLRPLVESPEERRRVGAESRAYAERVHDADRVAERLVHIYTRLFEPRPGVRHRDRS
jgi:glycosyltransferase involved in cell wall biosynthesis